MHGEAVTPLSPFPTSSLSSNVRSQSEHGNTTVNNRLRETRSGLLVDDLVRTVYSALAVFHMLLGAQVTERLLR